MTGLSRGSPHEGQSTGNQPNSQSMPADSPRILPGTSISKRHGLGYITIVKKASSLLNQITIKKLLGRRYDTLLRRGKGIQKRQDALLIFEAEGQESMT